MKAGSSSVGPRKINKKSMHMSITENNGAKNRTPAKSYIYRMNSSFSKEGGSSTKNTSNGPISVSNLPTINQNSMPNNPKNNGLSLKKRAGSYIKHTNSSL